MKILKFDLTNHYSLLTTAAALLLLALPFIVRPFIVSGVSMEPTLAHGERIWIDTIFWRLVGISRDDVIVFRNPHKKEQVEIKRIVGLPGEDVGQDGLTIHLGVKDYAVLGDNVDQSEDSRDFGAIQNVDIIGRVIMKL